MHDHPFQAGPRTDVHACTPLEPIGPPTPVDAYRALARELQEDTVATTAQQLDTQIAWIMANYGGYTPAAIMQAMHEASVYLAHAGDDDPTYIERTMAAAMQDDVWGTSALGWGA